MTVLLRSFNPFFHFCSILYYHITRPNFSFIFYTGLEATKIIKEDLKLSIPVIALTAETSESVKIECESIGFDDFQNKPLKRDTLKKLLNDFTKYDIK